VVNLVNKEELLSLLSKKELEELAYENKVSTEWRDILYRKQKSKSKKDLIYFLDESNKITDKKILKKLGVKKAPVELLLSNIAISKLKQLAKNNKVILEETGFWGTRKATSKKDIIKVLTKKLTPRKIRSFIEDETKKTTNKEEHIKQKITERKITRKKISKKETEVDFNEVLDKIKKTHFLLPKGKRKYEDAYEKQLYQRLSDFPRIRYEKSKVGSRLDLTIGNDEIGIELKKLSRGSTCRELHRLPYQINRYSKQFDHLIVVIINEGAKPDVLKEELEELKKHGVEIIVKDVIR
jgi:hypothetical protein